jgi:hypothetical protein
MVKNCSGQICGDTVRWVRIAKGYPKTGVGLAAAYHTMGQQAASNVAMRRLEADHSASWMTSSGESKKVTPQSAKCPITLAS